jgi:hypothetical protein
VSYIKPNGRHSRHNPNVPDIGPRRGRSFTPPGQQGFEPPKYTDPNDPHQPSAPDIRGKIGQTVFQLAIPPPWSPQAGEPKQLQRRRHVIPRDPRTMPQLRCRARWAAGVAAWHALSDEERKAYNDAETTKRLRIPGLSHFMRLWCRLHRPEEYEAQALLWSAQPELQFMQG